MTFRASLTAPVRLRLAAKFLLRLPAHTQGPGGIERPGHLLCRCVLGTFISIASLSHFSDM